MAHDFKRATLSLKCNQGRMIDFPGGSVEIARTSDGDYWAHIAIDRIDYHTRTTYTITDSRIDTLTERPSPVPDLDTLTHIAVRITPQPKTEGVR